MSGSRAAVRSFRVDLRADRCKACGFCAVVCARQVLEPGEALNRLGYQAYRARPDRACSGCLACGRICPEAAISIWEEE